jgi:cupin 2 domain-containing protein
MNNLFQLPVNLLQQEQFDILLEHNAIRIERILSHGHTTPEQGWYDQEEHEWVVVLQGGGEILFEGGERVRLLPGDSIEIPAHRKHRVVWTDPDEVTVWLAIFYV